MTLKDIARIANVNVSTVSKALRSSSDLNPRTVARIQKIAEEMNYKRSLFSEEKKDNRIGIVCPEITSMYYSSILHSLQLNFLEAGYQTVVMISNFDPRQETDCIISLTDNGVCGIVFFTENDIDTDNLKDISFIKDVAFVIVANSNENIFCDNICIDDHQGVTVAVSHLTELKHTKIAYIGDKLSTDRRVSYEQALQSKLISIVPEYVVESDLRFEECGYHGMKELLALADPPTAIFAAYDNIAIGAMRAIYESGLSIPDDISIVGIDNLKTSSYLYNALTTVTEPATDLGELTCDMMINRIRKNSTIRHIKLIPTLNIRETTAVNTRME